MGGVVDSESSLQELAPFIDGLSPEEYLAFISLSKNLLANGGKFGRISAAEISELLLTYSSRIRTVIKKSMDLSEKKDAYINTCLRYMAKSLHRARRRKNEVEEVLYSSWETEPSQEASSAYCADRQRACRLSPDERKSVEDIPPHVFLNKMPCESRRLLLLCLKCSWELDQAMIDKAASKLGIPRVWLEHLVNKAVMSLEPTRLKLKIAAEKMNFIWIQMRTLEMRLLKEQTAQQLEKSTAALERYKKRYKHLLREKQSTRTLVSNSTIASILKLPKGSVDSGLYYLKTRSGDRRPLAKNKREQVLFSNGNCLGDVESPQGAGTRARDAGSQPVHTGGIGLYGH